MKKEPNLRQKKPKRTLSENKMVHAGKIMLQSTTTYQKLPCDTKKISKMDIKKYMIVKRNNTLRLQKSSHN